MKKSKDGLITSNFDDEDFTPLLDPWLNTLNLWSSQLAQYSETKSFIDNMRTKYINWKLINSGSSDDWLLVLEKSLTDDMLTKLHIDKMKTIYIIWRINNI